MKPLKKRTINPIVWLLSLLSLLPLTVFADEASDSAIEGIKKKLPMLPIEEVLPLENTPYYRLRLQDGTLLYVSEDAKQIIAGDIYNVEGNRLVNLSETILNAERLTAVEAVAAEDTVLFPAKGDKIGTLYVFTDVDCGYCRRLHEEILVYQQSGVEVRYLAWPRCGTDCKSYRTMVNVWCSPDRQDAMTRAKRDEPIKEYTCDNPVADHFELGRKLGIRGTPLIILSTGRVIPGYQPAGEVIRLF